MKVLVYNDVNAHIGGAETFCHDLIAGAREKGHQVQFVSFREKGMPRQRLIGKIRYVFSNQLLQPSIIRAMAEAIAAFQPDVIHCHNNYAYTASVMYAIKRSKVPMIGTLHDFDLLAPFFQAPTPLRYLKKRQFRNILQQAQLITSPTHKLIRQLQPILGAKFTYLPLFVDFDRWPYQAKKHQNPPQIAFLGRIIPDKGIFVLLEAMKLLVKQFPEASLTYIGGGYELDGLKKLILFHGLDQHIRCTGYVSHEEVIRILNVSRFLVLPSIYEELFGLVGIEAQALGLPVIAADRGGISEWCMHEQTGLLYAAQDAPQLAEYMALLLRDQDFAQKLSHQAYHHIKTHYSRENCISKLIGIYEQALVRGKKMSLE
ncbi:MAG: glycosyltransferase family 4 protein [Bacteroidota bacterium]